MKGLFYLSGIRLVLTAKMPVRGRKNKKQPQSAIGFCVLALSFAYAVF